MWVICQLFLPLVCKLRFVLSTLNDYSLIHLLYDFDFKFNRTFCCKSCRVVRVFYVTVYSNVKLLSTLYITKTLLGSTYAWFNSTCYHLPPSRHTPGQLPFFFLNYWWSIPLPWAPYELSITQSLFWVQRVDDIVDFHLIANKMF